MAYFELGPVPSDEDCAQVGRDDYHKRTTRETRAYIAQLTRQFDPKFVSFRVKANRHDFGTYHEVVVEYNSDSVEACAEACKIEDSAPSRWDDVAAKELGIIR